MSLPNESAPGAGTSGPSSDAQPGPEFDYQRGYNELRPQFTRTTQELAEKRERLSEYEQLFEALHDSDPETQAAAMEALGLEMDTGSPESDRSDDDGFVDPLEEEIKSLRGVVDELSSARELEANREQDREFRELRDDYIGESIGFIEKSLNRTFSEKAEEALGNLAIALGEQSDDGMPDVQGAYNLLYGEEGVLETERAGWIASKTGAAVPPAGTSIPVDQKPKSRRERIAYIDERVAAMERQQ